MEMGKYIELKRKELGLTMEELGQRLNPPVKKSAVNKWEKGVVKNIKASHVEQLARIFEVSPSDLLCVTDSAEGFIRIPILGKVVAGVPVEACQDIIDYLDIPKKDLKHGSYFALKVFGDSMQPRILEGDILVVRSQNTADTGDIVVAMVDGQDATVKKLMKHKDGITLVAFNQSYEPMFFSNDEILSRPVTIIGRVMENRQKY
jgi:repressor LexA